MMKNSNEKSVLLEHPLITSYQKLHKIDELHLDTEFPIGLLVAVYQDYTGRKIVFSEQFENESIHYKANQMISFGEFFSPDTMEK